MNTAIFSPSGGNVGIAFAIPSSTVDSVVASLKDDGSVTRGFIGVQMQPVTKEIAEAIGLKEPKGALVAEAIKDSPAAKAGIRTGDTIIAVDGQTINEAKDLSRRVGHRRSGQVPLAHPVARRQGADRDPRGREPAQGRLIGRLIRPDNCIDTRLSS